MVEVNTDNLISTAKSDSVSKLFEKVIPSSLKHGISTVPQFWDVVDQVRELDIEPDDVWVITYPKSGTTWMQEAVWLLTHNLDYEGAKTLLDIRSPNLENCWGASWRSAPNDSIKEYGKNASLHGGRRVLKTHLHWKFLPKKLHNPDIPAKIIYVYRNPKDVCVSYYHYLFSINEEFRNLGAPLDKFVDWFMTDVISKGEGILMFSENDNFCTATLGPYWTHLRGYWEQRNNPNILIVKYEDMKKDLEAVIKTLASFLDVPVPTGRDMDKLLNHLSFQNMKSNPAVNREKKGSEQKPDSGSYKKQFIRKGIVGDWKTQLTPEMIEKLDKWIQKNTQDIDWTFEEEP